MNHHVHNEHRILVDAPADRAFLFFTPAGEELWVDGWRPDYVEPPDGHTSAGMVFTTGSGDDYTIWQLVDFDRAARRSRYVRTTPALRTGFVQIACEPLDADHCEVTVSYSLVALTPEGAASLDAYRGDNFRKMIDGWARSIGERLPALLEAEIR